MPDTSETRPRKRATNISLRSDLLQEARALGIGISQAAEEGLERAIAREKEARWLAENRDALESSNEWVERHGLPLEQYRQF